MNGLSVRENENRNRIPISRSPRGNHTERWIVGLIKGGEYFYYVRFFVVPSFRGTPLRAGRPVTRRRVYEWNPMTSSARYLLIRERRRRAGVVHLWPRTSITHSARGVYARRKVRAQRTHGTRKHTLYKAHCFLNRNAVGTRSSYIEAAVCYLRVARYQNTIIRYVTLLWVVVRFNETIEGLLDLKFSTIRYWRACGHT